MTFPIGINLKRDLEIKERIVLIFNQVLKK